LWPGTGEAAGLVIGLSLRHACCFSIGALAIDPTLNAGLKCFAGTIKDRSIGKKVEFE